MYQDRLCKELCSFCEEHGLKPLSADELYFETDDPKLRAWLRDYLKRWEVAVA